ncbi:MAG TPA: class I SAM-dependent methyltransferase [Nitrososphaerales archaeon]|nr:class I SAM-dependent methyltransferase [Nitrososphaerales archaeon]
MSKEESLGDASQGRFNPLRRPTGKTGYGIDDPRTVAELLIAGILAVAVGIIISAYTASSSPKTADAALIGGTGVGFLIFVVVAALYWSSRLGKPREMAKLVLSIPWGGEEVVLDLGCGRGLATVMAAKKLQTGYAVGVDMYHKSRVSGNDPRSVLANAARENVGPRVVAVKGSPVQLPFSDGSFDVIISGVAVHSLAPRRHRDVLFSEMVRVLKDGGRVGILDAGNGNEYSALLQRTGMRDIQMHRLRFSSFPPFHVVIARKPYSE